MNFGKLIFGVSLVGVGVLLFAAALGHLPPGVWPWLLKFWPFLLLAIGFALLANALKNVFIGVFAVLLAVGCFTFGGYWISRHTDTATKTHEAMIDLEKPPVQTVTVRGRTLCGSLEVGARPNAKRSIAVEVRGIVDKRFAAHRWSASGGAGLLVWPARSGIAEIGRIGGALRLRAPESTPIRLECEAILSSADFELTRLRPELCDIYTVGSTLRCTVGATRPPRIRIHGILSNAEIWLPADCPVRVECRSTLIVRSFPGDFFKHEGTGVLGASAAWTAEGTGSPVRIVVEGPFMRLRIVRDSVKAF